jgi:hypothetical protein
MRLPRGSDFSSMVEINRPDLIADQVELVVDGFSSVSSE